MGRGTLPKRSGEKEKREAKGRQEKTGRRKEEFERRREGNRGNQRGLYNSTSFPRANRKTVQKTPATKRKGRRGVRNGGFYRCEQGIKKKENDKKIREVVAKHRGERDPSPTTYAQRDGKAKAVGEGFMEKNA